MNTIKSFLKKSSKKQATACKLIPFSMVYRFQKHKVHLWEIRGSASSRAIFLIEKYKGFSKFIKEKYSELVFQFFNFKAIFSHNRIHRCNYYRRLVSKEASGLQQSHLWVRFWLNNSFKIQKLKIEFGIFFLYKFWKSFVFLDQKYRSRGSTSPYLSEMNLMFLESVDHREWD